MVDDSNQPLFLGIDAAAEYLGISPESLRSEISRKRRLGQGYLFKKELGRVLIDVAHYRDNPNYADKSVIEKIEQLYFEAIELYGNDFRLAKFIGPLIGINVHTAYMRLRDFRFKTTRTAGEMKMALEAAIGKGKKSDKA